MSLLNYNPAPFDSTLVGSTNELIGQDNLASIVNQVGSGKSKKSSSKKKASSKKSSSKKASSKKSSSKKASSKKASSKKASSKKVSSKKVSSKKVSSKKVSSKKVSEIKKFTRLQLVKLAKKHGVSLRKRDGNPRTKEQLFRSLKRKKLI